MMGLMRKDLPKKYLLMVDVCCIFLSFLLSAWIRYDSITNSRVSNNRYGVAFALVLLLYIVIYNLYEKGDIS